MTKKKEPPSPAYQLVAHVYRHSLQATSHSWTRLNTALHQALMIAIESGITFAEGDFAAIAKDFRSDKWMGTPPEGFYCVAIQVGNMSAVKSFEAWKGRMPFIVDDRQYARDWTGPKQRASVGLRFYWKDEWVKVTSFNDADHTITVCSYHDTNRYEHKIKHRYLLTIDDIKTERKERKERQRLWDRICDWINEDTKKRKPIVKRAFKKLGVTLNEQWFVSDVDKLRSVVEKLTAKDADD